MDEADSAQSHTVVESLREGGGLRFMLEDDPTKTQRQDAENMVQRGRATMAIVLIQQGDQISAKLLADASDQVAGQVVSALVTRSMLIAANSVPSSQFPNPASVPRENAKSDSSTTSLPSNSSSGGREKGGVGKVEIVDIIGRGKDNPVVSMYAAGIAVMFLLFGASGGGGALLDERESQTLDRLLSTQMTMDQLLLGKWFYLTIIGVLQVTVMFVWGQVVYGVDLLGHIDGFVMMAGDFRPWVPACGRGDGDAFGAQLSRLADPVAGHA